MAVIKSKRITSFTKTDRQGYHAENDIFGEEALMTRFSVLEDKTLEYGRKTAYYCFSIRTDDVLLIEVSRGEELDKDKRPYNNYEVCKLHTSSSANSGDAVYQLMEAALKKRTQILSGMDEFAEAMCIFGKYIPKPLREQLRFSDDDTASSGVIPVKEGVPEPADRYIKEYCSAPEKYFGGFDEVVKKYFAKGGYGGDEYFVFCKYMAAYDIPCEARNVSDKCVLTDHTIEFRVSKGTKQKPVNYPDRRYLGNKLYALAHINLAYSYWDIDMNTKIWDEEDIRNIAEFISALIQECKTSEESMRLLGYVRPSVKSKRGYLFESLENMLAGKTEGTSSAYALMCFGVSDYPYRRSYFTKQDADPFGEMLRFYRKEKPDSIIVKTFIKKIRHSDAGMFHTLRYRLFLR